jgi:hypothetical protein
MFFVLVLESRSSGPAFIGWPVDFVGATEGFSPPAAFLRSGVLTFVWLLVSPAASCCLFILRSFFFHLRFGAAVCATDSFNEQIFQPPASFF